MISNAHDTGAPDGPEGRVCTALPTLAGAYNLFVTCPSPGGN